MARIRYIKPEFFEDTKLTEASVYSRLLYIGLWCWMDRQGIVEDEPKIIKKNIFPYEDKVTIKKVISLIDELVLLGCLVRISYNGRNFLFCPKFSTHQKFHPGESAKYVIPHETLQASVEQPASNLQNTYKQPANNPLTLTGTGTGTGTETTFKKPSVAGSDPHPLFNLWNKYCGELPKIKEFDDKRKDRTLKQWKRRPDPNYWTAIIQKMASDDWCTGKKPSKGHESWKATFDFMLKEETQTKVIEGNIGGKFKPKSAFDFETGRMVEL